MDDQLQPNDPATDSTNDHPTPDDTLEPVGDMYHPASDEEKLEEDNDPPAAPAEDNNTSGQRLDLNRTNEPLVGSEFGAFQIREWQVKVAGIAPRRSPRVAADKALFGKFVANHQNGVAAKRGIVLFR